ncbi:MAG: hypothetical protein ABTQ29_02710 [Siculibacillus sp.]
MTNSTTLTAGIDASKAKLDIAVPDAGLAWTVADTIEGRAALARRLAEIAVARARSPSRASASRRRAATSAA